MMQNEDVLSNGGGGLDMALTKRGLCFPRTLHALLEQKNAKQLEDAVAKEMVE